MMSGVVPLFIVYGMQIIHPGVFLLSACVICAVVSVLTGSSWTTIATIGIALLGIGLALVATRMIESLTQALVRKIHNTTNIYL